VGKQEGKIPLGRPRCRWENNTSVNIIATALEAGDRIDVFEDIGGLLRKP
jgi:hypothetical protein